MLLMQQSRRAGAVADEDVGIAVVVDVAKRGAAARFDELQGLPGARGHVLEAAVRRCETTACAAPAETDRRGVPALQFWFTSPLTASRSSQPSLSKSSQAVPKPV